MKFNKKAISTKAFLKDVPDCKAKKKRPAYSDIDDGLIHGKAG